MDLINARDYGDTEKAAKLQKQLDRNATNMEYIGSTIRGAGGSDDVDSWIDTKGEGNRIYDEFIE